MTQNDDTSQKVFKNEAWTYLWYIDKAHVFEVFPALAPIVGFALEVQLVGHVAAELVEHPPEPELGVHQLDPVQDGLLRTVV